MKTFIFEGREFNHFKDMEEANDRLPLGHGVWDERKAGAYACAHNGEYKMNRIHYAWIKGNFFD